MTTSPSTTRAMAARRRSAFTLVEAVATMSIISIVVVVSSRAVFAAADGYASAATRSEQVNAMSAALERVTAEIRQMAFRPSTTPTEPYLDAITAASISWEGGKSLSLNGTNLQLTSTAGGTPRTLLESVSGFTVQAYDESNTALAASLSGNACDAVRRIQITITTTKYGISETLRCKVFLRCMMSGASP